MGDQRHRLVLRLLQRPQAGQSLPREVPQPFFKGHKLASLLEGGATAMASLRSSHEHWRIGYHLNQALLLVWFNDDS